jgi:hypothetical protein
MNVFNKDASSVSFPMFPKSYGHCEKHGEQENYILVEHGGDNDGYFCQKCYVENVILPNCKKLVAHV